METPAPSPKLQFCIFVGAPEDGRLDWREDPQSCSGVTTETPKGPPRNEYLCPWSVVDPRGDL